MAYSRKGKWTLAGTVRHMLVTPHEIVVDVGENELTLSGSTSLGMTNTTLWAAGELTLAVAANRADRDIFIHAYDNGDAWPWFKFSGKLEVEDAVLIGGFHCLAQDDPETGRLKGEPVAASLWDLISEEVEGDGGAKKALNVRWALGLDEYADNAAAIAGGLALGEVYRTATGELMVVVEPVGD